VTTGNGILLKQILKARDVEVLTGYLSISKGQMAGFC